MNLAARTERLIFGHRVAVIVTFGAVTVLMMWFAAQLKIDAGFSKLLPLKHPYMQAFVQYRDEFGGANRILIALVAKEGDIFTPRFFAALKDATDEVFFLPGVDRSKVKSLFTPNVRFTEVVAGGIAGGNVVPADFTPTPEGLARVRENILKAGILGRLVANDFSGAMVSAELLDFDPDTGERLDYADVAQGLEERIRKRFQNESGGDLSVHIIGFAKIVGDMTDGARYVVVFFAVSFLITAVLLYAYSSSVRMTGLVLLCSVLAVIWQLGMLPMLGFGLDPMSILVPFLVFAIAVSHGMQVLSALRAEVYREHDFVQGSHRAFRRIILPGTVALASDTIGFITILLIDIGIIREMAIAASIGVAVIILTNLILLPVLVSYLRGAAAYRVKLVRRAEVMEGIWARVSVVAKPSGSRVVLIAASGLLLLGIVKGTDVEMGDVHQGVPELRRDSTYNVDSTVITEKFSIGVDVLTVFAETVPEGCVDYDVMHQIDKFGWYMYNIAGVQSVLTLPMIAKEINAGWNEGYLKWRVLPRNRYALVQATSPVETSSGLLNKDCSVLPVIMFAEDHKAATIQSIVSAVKAYDRAHGSERLRFRLAGSNVGVMAATNEAVAAAQFPILLYVFAAVVVLCLVSFRSVTGTLCIVIPLGLVSLLTYALMSYLEIGLKVNTLPVVALGVGIGVDYGIYVFSRFQSILEEGYDIPEGYNLTLAITGFGVVFTGCTLAIGVATWIFSPLQFQADMGILLTFMFVMNMLGAILLLPALASRLLSGRCRPAVITR